MMGSSWALAYILWGIVVALVVALWVHEECKSPEQRKKEQEKQIREHEEYLQQERLEKQLRRSRAAKKGDLQSWIVLWFISWGFVAVVIISIMLLISTTM